MEERNELGDIILNKNNKGGSKKIILAVATLGIILIIVVLLMNSLSDESQENLPQSALPPKPQKELSKAQEPKEEPLFEDVEVIDEGGESENEKLDKIAKKLKENTPVKEPVVEQIEAQKVVVEQPKPKVSKKVQHVKPKPKPAPKQTHQKAAPSGRYYVQVGSFTRYEPNKKFLASIKNNGYDYRYHKTSVNGRTITKVLVGPFRTEKEARNALRNIRKRIVKDAFLTKL